jgi:hypothetical protein
VSRAEDVPLTAKEMELVRRIARRDNRSEEEVATELVRSALARRVRKRIGKGPARVYGLKNK